MRCLLSPLLLGSAASKRKPQVCSMNRRRVVASQLDGLHGFRKEFQDAS
jgi:hypothetical protein